MRYETNRYDWNPTVTTEFVAHNAKACTTCEVSINEINLRSNRAFSLSNNYLSIVCPISRFSNLVLN